MSAPRATRLVRVFGPQPVLEILDGRSWTDGSQDPSPGSIPIAGALAVDIALVRVANVQLQTALDAAALAAEARLDGTADGVELARTVALEVAALNPVIHGHTVLADHLVFGHWSEEDIFEPTSDPQLINAVHVEGAHRGLPSVLAGAAFGKDVLHTNAMALAARPMGGPAAEVDCWLPIALPYCEWEKHAGTIPDPTYVKFGTDKVDNVGWAHPEGSNTASLRDQLQGNCADPIGVGDPIYVSNGGNNAVVKEITSIIEGTSEGNVSDWPYETFPDGPPLREEPWAFPENKSTIKKNWGRVIGGTIALVDLDCDDPKWNNATTPPKIMGFTHGFIYDVLNGNAHDTGFMLQLDFVNDYGGGTRDGGGADGNVILWLGPAELVK